MIEFIKNIDFLHNDLFWIAFFANFIAQILKIFTHLITEKEFNIKRAIETGGMPSSHAASVASLATGVGIKHGFDSSLFAIAAVFALVVLYDASGVRREAGEHAQALNSIMNDLQHLFKDGFQEKQFKTLLGHTKLQVLSGTILGALIATFALKVLLVGNV